MACSVAPLVDYHCLSPPDHYPATMITSSAAAHGQAVDLRVTVMSLAQGLGVDYIPLCTLHFLNGPDIARAGLANRFLYRAARNEGVWQAARDRLWEDKVFVSERAKAQRCARDAYVESVRDSRRTWLERDELISFSWWFRFKQQAGEAWTAQDPWYRNEKVRE